MTDSTARDEYVAGLRALADVLESNPQLRLPLQQTFSAFCKDRDELHAWLQAAPGQKDKALNGDERYMVVGKRVGVFGPHGFLAWIERDEVCRRVVTGTREVTKTVPAAGAPMVEVTETVEDVEWVCSSLLAEAVSS